MGLSEQQLADLEIQELGVAAPGSRASLLLVVASLPLIVAPLMAVLVVAAAMTALIVTHVCLLGNAG